MAHRAAQNQLQPTLWRNREGPDITLVDQRLALAVVPDLEAVGLGYRQFEPVEDARVLELLEAGY